MAVSSPISVQSEISACFAILALADSSKLDLLNAGILDALIPMTLSPNQEVSGNSAAAIANLCSRINNYQKIIQCWNEPNDGIRGFLIRFLQSDYATFEHIALWTILQLLESHNVKILELIKQDDELISGIKKMAVFTSNRLKKSGYDVKGNDMQKSKDNASNDNTVNNAGQNGTDDDIENSESPESGEDASLELYNITQQILEFLQ